MNVGGWRRAGWGAAVVSLGDLDGDGVGDIAADAPGSSSRRDPHFGDDFRCGFHDLHPAL